MPPKEPRVPKGPLERRNKSRIMVDIGIDLLSQSFSTPTANSPNEANNVTIKANEANKANNFGNQAKHARITPNTSNTVHQTSKQVKKNTTCKRRRTNTASVSFSRPNMSTQASFANEKTTSNADQT